MIIVIIVILVILAFVYMKLYMNMKKKDVEDILNNQELDKMAVDLIDNVSICEQILKMLNVENVNVKLNPDKTSGNSFFNTFSREIILCNNDKVNRSYTRVLYIAHECVHAMQKQAYLKFNFIFANINMLFCIISTILVWFNVIKEPIYLGILAITLILNMFSFFARNVIESDATYMSVLVAKEFLEKFLPKENVETIISKYKQIISNGYSTFSFSLFTTNLSFIFIQVISMLVCTYIY